MSIMRDSNVDDAWLRDVMAKNPPQARPNGELFTGPVRLAFVKNLLEPDEKGKFGCALLFPPGTDMSLFEQAALKAAREKFPKDFDDQGRPVGLHFPFHDQREKAFGAKPLSGYTPGGIFFNVSSNYKPQVFDLRKQPVTDSSKVYAGVWAFLIVNTYTYGPPQPKKGVSFGIQSVMVAYDDAKLAGGGNRDAAADFGAVQLTASSDIASRFDDAGGGAGGGAAGTSIMPGGGHVGRPGGLATHALPASETAAEREARELREMMG